MGGGGGGDENFYWTSTAGIKVGKSSNARHSSSNLNVLSLTTWIANEFEVSFPVLTCHAVIIEPKPCLSSLGVPAGSERGAPLYLCLGTGTVQDMASGFL